MLEDTGAAAMRCRCCRSILGKCRQARAGKPAPAWLQAGRIAPALAKLKHQLPMLRSQLPPEELHTKATHKRMPAQLSPLVVAPLVLARHSALSIPHTLAATGLQRQQQQSRCP